MDNIADLRDPDGPMYGPVRGCDVCGENKPTDEVLTFKDQHGEWQQICKSCQERGA